MVKTLIEELHLCF